MDNIMIVATCTFGMETVLKREITNLGYKIEKVEDGKIYFLGSLKDIARVNLWLRSANRVLIYVDKFEALTFDELFDNVNEIEFEKYFSKDDSFNVTRITSSKSNLFSKRDCQKIIKKSIVERLKRVYKTKTLKETGIYYELIVNIKKDIVSIFINTSGEGLHKRGYRENALKAPLKETLSAGIILLSNYQKDFPFADIMCGSGTNVIEAAMIAMNKAPGLNRDFAFTRFDPSLKKELLLLKEEARENEIKLDYRLLGSDTDYRGIKCANENAALAGVSDSVAFQKLDMREFKSRKKNGFMILNPPYAERIGEARETLKLYKDLGKVYESLNDWRLFVLCGNKEFEESFGEKATRNRKLFNGNMLSYLYQYYPKRDEHGKS